MNHHHRYMFKRLDDSAKDFDRVLGLTPRDWKARYFRAFISYQHRKDYSAALKVPCLSMYSLYILYIEEAVLGDKSGGV